MEVYRHENQDQYCVIIFKNSRTGKIDIVHNYGDESRIRRYWKLCEPNYDVLEVKAVVDITALEYFIYWDLLPRGYRTSSQRRKKFDFYKYVLGADLSNKYRDKANISQIEE